MFGDNRNVLGERERAWTWTERIRRGSDTDDSCKDKVVVLGRVLSGVSLREGSGEGGVMVVALLRLEET